MLKNCQLLQLINETVYDNEIAPSTWLPPDAVGETTTHSTLAVIDVGIEVESTTASHAHSTLSISSKVN